MDEEQQDRPPEKAGSVLRQIVEDTADDESHARVANESAESDGGIANETSPTAPEAEPDLLQVG